MKVIEIVYVIIIGIEFINGINFNIFRYCTLLIEIKWSYPRSGSRTEHIHIVNHKVRIAEIAGIKLYFIIIKDNTG